MGLAWHLVESDSAFRDDTNCRHADVCVNDEIRLNQSRVARIFILTSVNLPQDLFSPMVADWSMAFARIR